MRFECLLAAFLIGLTGQACAADSGSASPYDTNPACLDTKTDSSTGNCIIQNEGTPRHRYPPPGPSSLPGNTLGTGTGAGTTTSPATSPAPASPTLRQTAPAAGGK